MKKVVAVVLLVLFSVPAFAYVMGPTNFGPMGYPDHGCFQPRIPIANDEYLWASFKREALRYEQCIQEYVDAAEYDRRRVLDSANEAIDEYNNFINSTKRGY